MIQEKRAEIDLLAGKPLHCHYPKCGVEATQATYSRVEALRDQIPELRDSILNPVPRGRYCDQHLIVEVKRMLKAGSN